MTDTTTAPRQPLAATEVALPPAPVEAPLAGTRRDMPARVIPHREARSVDEWRESSDRIPVFTVTHDDGSHRTFTMPAKPHPGIALRFLRELRVQGDAALIGLLETVLDEGAVDVIVDEVGAMDADESGAFLRDLSERVQRNLAGGLKR